MAETPFYRKYWKGLVFGFLFGTLGLWLLAILSLISQVFEFLSSFLFAPGRALSAALFGAQGSDGAVALLMLANGILYALVGLLIQWIILRAKK